MDSRSNFHNYRREFAAGGVKLPYMGAHSPLWYKRIADASRHILARLRVSQRGDLGSHGQSAVELGKDPTEGTCHAQHKYTARARACVCNMHLFRSLTVLVGQASVPLQTPSARECADLPGDRGGAGGVQRPHVSRRGRAVQHVAPPRAAQGRPAPSAHLGGESGLPTLRAGESVSPGPPRPPPAARPTHRM